MKRSDARALRLATRSFRAVTLLLPPGFRRAAGEPMTEALRDEAREALDVSGPALLSHVWLAAVGDLVRVAAQEWSEALGRLWRRRVATGRGEVMESLLRDVRHSLLALARSPGFTLAAVATLAIGIGLNTTLFSVTSSVLFRPLPIQEPDRLTLVYATGRGPGYGRFSFPDLRDFANGTSAFESLAGSHLAGVTLRREGNTQALFGQIVTANYFETFRARPHAGRFFAGEVEESADRAAVVVLSHRAWKRHFAADPEVVGRTLNLNGHALTVVGIAPEGFRGAYNFFLAPEFWAPLAALPTLDPEQVQQIEERSQGIANIVGRLRDGATLAEAQAQLDTVTEQLTLQYPDIHRDRRARLFRELDTRPEAGTASVARLALGAFQGLAGLVLLVACANVSNLMLARAAARRREVAIRLAIGAGRWQLVRQLLTEGFLLAGMSAVVGFGVSVALVRRIGAMSMPTYFPMYLDVGVDGRSLVFAMAVATVTALAFALLPALQSARSDLVPALRGDGPRGGARRPRLAHALVTAQMAVSIVLLVASGLFLRSMLQAEQVPLGYETERTLLATLNLDQPDYDQGRRRRLVLDLAERVAALPGVQGASYAAPVPMEFNTDGGLVYAEGSELREGQEGLRTLWSAVGPGYFAVAGTPLLAGRGFDLADDADSRPVAVVNEHLAEMLWPGSNPIGRMLRFESRDSEPVEVVGVAPTAKYNTVVEPPLPFVYRPLLQRDIHGPTLLVRTAGEPEAAAPSVRAALHDLAPGVPLLEVKSYADLIEGRAMLGFRSGASLSGVVGLVALALAIVGLYGVVALGVSRRTREIGVRMALGAERSGVVGLVVRQGMRLVLVGVALGLIAAAAVGRVLAGLLVGVGGTDPATFAGVVLAMVAVAGLATWLPARRAARVDPVTALRAE